MEFRLLGAVGLETGEGSIPLGPAKRRALLATLGLRPNVPVPVGTLTRALWSAEPPVRARTVIQGHVSRLRTALRLGGADAYGIELATQGDSYVLWTPESLIDVHRFEELVTLAGAQREVRDTVAMLREALSLWQGPALSGTVASPPLLEAASALDEARLATVERLAEAHGKLGEHPRAASLLRAEVVVHPLRESTAAALMLALYRSGRQAEALDLFHRTRRLLRAELGVDPGPELVEAYQVILQGDAPGAQRRSSGAPRVADHLPRAPRGFVGRTAELRALERAVVGEAPIALVTGPAGVGKTALVAQWAHAHPGAFPDGRLFVSLEPASAGRGLQEVLRALGVDEPPSEVADAAGMFRGMTADRRMLLVIDGASSVEDVQALLPSGAGCTTVVTSRYRLTGLVAAEAARPVALGALSGADAGALVARVAGAERVDGAAAGELAEMCFGLPSALRAAAARLAYRPGLSLRGLVEELGDEERRLVVLDAEGTGLVAGLDATVAHLPGVARVVMGVLGSGASSAAAVSESAGLALRDVLVGLDWLAAAYLGDERPDGAWELVPQARLYVRCGLLRGDGHARAQ